jgi:hypothetical protein
MALGAICKEDEMPKNTRPVPQPGEPPPQKSGAFLPKASPTGADRSGGKASGRKSGKAADKSRLSEPPPQKSGSFSGKPK